MYKLRWGLAIVVKEHISRFFIGLLRMEMQERERIADIIVPILKQKGLKSQKRSILPQRRYPAAQPYNMGV